MLLDLSININTIGAMIIASVIFSFAELFYSLDSIKKDALSIEIDAETVQSEALIKQQEIINELIDQSCTRKDEIFRNEFCIEFQPRSDLPELERKKLLNDVAKNKKRYVELLEANRKQLQKKDDENKKTELLVEALREDIQSKKIIIQKDPIFANALMFFGILVFLVLLIADKAIVFDNKVNSIITVIAFVVLVLNYYIRRIYASLIKEDLKTYKDHAQYYLDINSNKADKKIDPPIIPHRLYSQKKR